MEAMKVDESAVQRVADRLAKAGCVQTGERRVLEALAIDLIRATIEPQERWPTPETLNVAYDTYFDERDRRYLTDAQARLRRAMVEHDPIIKAALALGADLLAFRRNEKLTTDSCLVWTLLDELLTAGLEDELRKER